MKEPNEKREWKEEFKEMLNNPRTGLRDSSDTNKTRYGILALFEEALSKQKEEVLELIEAVESTNKRYKDGEEIEPEWSFGKGFNAALKQIKSKINSLI